MATAGNITAVLTLNSKGFQDGLTASIEAVTLFDESLKKVNATRMRNAISVLKNDLVNLMTTISGVNSKLKQTTNFNNLALALKRVSEEIVVLSSDSIKVENAITIMNNMFKAWGDVLGKTKFEIQNVTKVIREMGNESTSSTNKVRIAFKGMQEDLLSIGKGVEPMARVREQADLMKAEFDKARQGMLSFANTGVEAFNNIDAQSNRTKEQIRLMSTEFEKAKAELLEFARYGRSQFEKVAVGESKVTQQTRLMSEQFEKASVGANRLSFSVNSASSSMNKGTSSASKMATATSRLGKVMSSLKSIGTLVGSMLAWNFAHNLLVATNETIQAKSETEGYFKMLGLGKSEIDKFNQGLDATISRFKRINKYSLAETVSSIGVEFDLTTDEMVKAMDVTSMITSEYLRAGRNANEASLAVKDVLQGQFQRLSRETGVKGEQLKEAGWSGDTSDVESLLDALRKVGESRHWDTFAEKANSLTDVVTILQNRFSEWSADMVSTVQPAIVSSFNAILSVGGALGSILSGLWDWLNGDGIANQVVKWSLLASAIGTVVTAFVGYRVSAGLVQIAEMGLRGSIMATILGLKAEEVATYGTRTAIASKITGLNAEAVAQGTLRSAILGKILGLDAEMVANNGVKGAIMSTVFARELEEASISGMSTTQLGMLAIEQQERLSKMRTSSVIIGKIASVNMETLAEKGLIVALAERIASSPLYIGSLEAEEVAELSTAEASLILAGTLLPLVAVFVAVAGAVYGLVKWLMDASEEMKSFNNLVQNGDNIIKSNKNTVDSYKNSISQLKEEQSKLTKGSAEYVRKQREIDSATSNLEQANKNYENSIKAVEMARSSQSKFDERISEIAIEKQNALSDAYEKAGISSQKASEMAHSGLLQAQEGAEQLRNALQMIKLEADKSSENASDIVDVLSKNGMSPEKIEQYGENLTKASDKVTEGMERFMTSDDWMDRIGGWFEIQQGRFEEWWTDLNAFFEVQDWDSVRDKIIEGLEYVFSIGGLIDFDQFEESYEDGTLGQYISNMLLGSDGGKSLVDTILNAVAEIAPPLIVGLAKLIPQINQAIGLIILQLFVSLVQSIGGMIYNNLLTPLGEQIYMAFVHLGEGLYSGIENIGKGIQKAVGGFLEWINLDNIGDWVNDNLLNPLFDWVNSFDGEDILNAITSAFDGMMSGLGDWWSSLDLGKYLTNFDLIGMIWDWILPDTVSASDGGDESHPNVATEMNQVIVQPIRDWINGFKADPVGYLMNGVEMTSPIGAIVGAIFGVSDATDWSWATDWLNENIVTPIQNAINTFMEDPIGTLLYLGSSQSLVDGAMFIASLLPPIDATAIWNYVNTNIIQPFGQAIWSGILSIPILGDILQLLGYTDQSKGTSSQKGTNIGNAFGNALQTVIGNVPILGDLLKLLGVIDTEKPTAKSKGNSFGDSIHNGITGAIGSISDGVKQEFQDAINGIGKLGQQAYDTAKGWADQLWQGVNSILQRHSPGFFYDQFKAEFGTDVPNAIQSSGETAYAVAQGYAQNIKQGIADSGTTTIGMDSMVTDYQNDAQTIATSSQMMGNDTTTAFNQMQSSVNLSTNQMQGNVTSSYNTMQTKQQLALNTMKSKNTTAYNEMYLKSNQSLIQMRDSTSNVTTQMTNAWTHMKDQIVASANKLKTDSTSHFNSLSTTIGGFYRKIQNPSNWGAGSPSLGRTKSRRSPSVGKRVARRIGSSKHGAGVSPYSNKDKVMSIRELLSMTEMSGTTKVDMDMFLSSLIGEHGLGWNDWSGTHFNHIKNKSNQWQMKAPMIMGYISAGNGYKVGEFANGKPDLTWDSFMDTAEAVFSNIDYDFYFDSNKYGNWVNALRHGMTNCSDGSEALIALAQTFGFDGYKQHTTLSSGVGHFYAIINGKAMDTTHFQNGRSWSPLGGAGIPSRSGSSYRGSGVTPSNNTTVNVTITGDVYGIDDLDSKINESVRKGLREEFNDPYGVAL